MSQWIWVGFGFCLGQRGEFTIVVSGSEEEAACALKVTRKRFRQGFRRVMSKSRLAHFVGIQPGQVWAAPRGTIFYKEVDPMDLEV